jgi:hypothetical protein
MELREKMPLEFLRYEFNDTIQTFTLFQYGPVYYIPRCMVAYTDDGIGLWTGKSAVKRYLGTMVNYDMCNQINPSVKKLTTKMMEQYWKGIISVRKDINSADFADYEQEIRENNLVWTKRWIHYNDSSKLMQLYMVLAACSKCWQFVFRCKGGHIYHKYIKRDRR